MSDHLLAEKNHENFGHNIRLSDTESKRTPPDRKSGAYTNLF